jgi:hypothetical protein
VGKRLLFDQRVLFAFREESVLWTQQVVAHGGGRADGDEDDDDDNDGCADEDGSDDDRGEEVGGNDDVNGDDDGDDGGDDDDGDNDDASDDDTVDLVEVGRGGDSGSVKSSSSRKVVCESFEKRDEEGENREVFLPP